MASQVQTAVSMRTVTKSMTSVVGSLDKALSSNQMEQVSMIMDTFEKQIDNLGVQTTYMETAMKGSTQMTTPEDQVSSLMQQVADEHGLELNEQMLAMATPSAVSVSAQQREENAKEDELAERLAKLRNTTLSGK